MPSTFPPLASPDRKSHRSLDTAAARDGTFAPGEDVKYVDVPIIGNSTIQPDRTVKLVLSNPSPGGVSIVRGAGIGKIIDDDTPTCRFSAPTTLPKAVVGTAYGPIDFIPFGGDAINDFSVVLHAGSVAPPGLNFALVDPAGIINAYGRINGTPKKAGSYTFTLDLTCPLQEGGMENYWQTFTMNVETGLSKVFVTMPDQQVVEGNAGFTPVQMTVTLSATRGSDTTFRIVTTDAGATVLDNDYVPIANQLVTVPAGQLQTTFNVNVVGDLIPEGNEQFIVSIYHTVGSLDLALSLLLALGFALVRRRE